MTPSAHTHPGDSSVDYRFPFPDSWSGRRDSNPRPTAWKAVTLPLSYSRKCGLRRVNVNRKSGIDWELSSFRFPITVSRYPIVVGREGFEPP